MNKNEKKILNFINNNKELKKVIINNIPTGATLEDLKDSIIRWEITKVIYFDYKKCLFNMILKEIKTITKKHFYDYKNVKSVDTELYKVYGFDISIKDNEDYFYIKTYDDNYSDIYNAEIKKEHLNINLLNERIAIELTEFYDFETLEAIDEIILHETYKK